MRKLPTEQELIELLRLGHVMIQHKDASEANQYYELLKYPQRLLGDDLYRNTYSTEIRNAIKSAEKTISLAAHLMGARQNLSEAKNDLAQARETNNQRAVEEFAAQAKHFRREVASYKRAVSTWKRSDTTSKGELRIQDAYKEKRAAHYNRFLETFYRRNGFADKDK